MIKLIIVFLFSLKILLSNDDIVKTSELELFLFKVGFESLLKDVDLNKDKTTLNEKEIKLINEKIELIMSELYKNSRVLKDDSSEVKIIETVNNQELENLKVEIKLLKNEIKSIKKLKIEEYNKKTNIKKERIITNSLKKVSVDSAYIYSRPLQNSKIIRTLQEGTLVDIESCDKFGWCKLNRKKEYIKQFLIK